MNTYTLKDAQRLKDGYESDGYVALSGGLPPGLIQGVLKEIETILRAEARRHLPSRPRPEGRFDASLQDLFGLNPQYRSQLYQVFQSMLGLYDIGLSEPLKSVARILELKAPNFRNVAIRIDLPNEDKFLQPLHQDVRDMRSENAINFWIPLQDVEVKNGALNVYPGSHKLKAIECQETNASGYQVIRESQVEGFSKLACTLKAGDVLAFSPYLVHGSNANRSERTRWTITIRYDDATEMPWMIDGRNPFKALDIQKT